jgi:hypothetical protein
MKKLTTEISSKRQQYGLIKAIVCDKHGNVKQEVEQSVDSFNRHMWRWMYNNFYGTNPQNIISLSNSSISPSGNIFGRTADGQANGYAGIVIGTGSAAMTYDTVTMESIVDHGMSSGQVFAGETTCEFDASTGVATTTRSFVSMNSASSTLGINEVGIAIAIDRDAAKNLAILMIRDVLQSTLNVEYEDTITIQYKVRMAQGTNNMTNAFINVYGRSGAATLGSFTNTTNVAASVSSTAFALNVLAQEGVLARGIVFGTSNAAFAKTQVDLSARIAHGNSAGQLFYHPVTNTVIEENSTTNSMRFMLMRTVENRSGSNVTIAEAGLFANSSATFSFMLDRKLIDPPVTVTNGNTVTFTWEFCYEV